MHVYNQSKEQKQEHNAELQPNIIYTSTLTQFYLMDWRHTHTFTQNPKKRKWRLPCAHRVLLPRPQLSAPPAWSVSSCFAPPRVGRTTPRAGFWERTGFSGAVSARTKGERKPSILGVGRGKWRTLRPTSGVSGPHRLRRTLGQEPSNRNSRTGTLELHLGICTQLFNLHEDWLECTWRVYLA